MEHKDNTNLAEFFEITSVHHVLCLVTERTNCKAVYDKTVKERQVG